MEVINMKTNKNEMVTMSKIKEFKDFVKRVNTIKDCYRNGVYSDELFIRELENAICIFLKNTVEINAFGRLTIN